MSPMSLLCPRVVLTVCIASRMNRSTWRNFACLKSEEGYSSHKGREHELELFLEPGHETDRLLPPLPALDVVPVYACC